MAFTLDQVIPWGRCLDEYIEMFDLNLESLRGEKILDCGGGPASFNQEMTNQGYSVMSCDPIDQWTGAEISQRIAETYPKVVRGLTENLGDYVWHKIKSPEHLGQVRMAAMSKFLEDFERGKVAGRYQIGGVPGLPFATQEFNLALCSHLLFSYSEQLSLEFHIASVLDLCRVAEEVRIFPLITIGMEPSRWVPGVLTALSEAGYQFEVKTVVYEFQKGGNQMLRIRQ